MATHSNILAWRIPWTKDYLNSIITLSGFPKTDSLHFYHGLPECLSGLYLKLQGQPLPSSLSAVCSLLKFSRCSIAQTAPPAFS